jgi:anti-sigma B factor antagonist
LIERNAVSRVTRDPGAAGWAVITVTGDLDIVAAPRLREEPLDAISNGNARLLLDLTGATFLDSTGIGVIVGAHKRLRAQGGDLRVAAASRAILEPLRITGLHRVLRPYPSLEAALAEDQPNAGNPSDV